jgi:WD repeat-containing protein 7
VIKELCVVFQTNSVFAASSLILDTTRFLTEAGAIVKSPSSGKKILAPVLGRLRSVLSAFLTPGLNEEIDAICRNSLLIPAAAIATGFSR